MEDFGILYALVVYLRAKCYILWPFGTFCSHLEYFFNFGTLYREKSGNPGGSAMQKSLKMKWQTFHLPTVS
jgi:hypothetical protein